MLILGHHGNVVGRLLFTDFHEQIFQKKCQNGNLLKILMINIGVKRHFPSSEEDMWFTKILLLW